MATLGNVSPSSHGSSYDDTYEELSSLETVFGNGLGTSEDPITFGSDDDESSVEVQHVQYPQEESLESRNSAKIPEIINVLRYSNKDETDESNPPDSEVEEWFDGSSTEDTEPTEDSMATFSFDFEDDAVSFSRATDPPKKVGEQKASSISEEHEHASFSRATAPPKKVGKRNVSTISEEHDAPVPNNAVHPENVGKRKARFNVNDTVVYKGSKMVYGPVKVTALREIKGGYVCKIDWNGQSRGQVDDETWWPEEDFEEPSTKRARRPNVPTNVSRERECRVAQIASPENDVQMRKKVETALLSLPCTFKDGVVSETLDSVPYPKPIGLETVLERIQSIEGGLLPASFPDDEFKIGDRVRRALHTRICPRSGNVVPCEPSFVEGGITQAIHSDSVPKMYRVVYENGNEEDLHPRHLRVPPQEHGRRKFHFLELFSGKGVMSEAFKQLDFTVQSVDITTDDDAISPPTLEMDINEFRPKADLDKIPDVVHISLPCETYSKLSGDHHRVTTSTMWKHANLDISPDAREHDFLFVKVIQILVYIKKRNPNLVVIIENPKAKLRHMPLMVSNVELSVIVCCSAYDPTNHSLYSFYLNRNCWNRPSS